MEIALAPFILAALILVPLAEIAVFIKVGGLIGAGPTIALVIAIAVFGTWLLRRQGLETFRKAQMALGRGEMPVGAVLDSFLLVLAALLMVTPGLLTDAIGLLLLVPPLRRLIGRHAAQWFMAHANVQFGTSAGMRADWGQGPIIEGEAVEDEPGAKDTTGKPPASGASSPWRGSLPPSSGG